MKTITPLDIFNRWTCYTLEQITAAFEGKEACTALELLDQKSPAHDRLWVVVNFGVLADGVDLLFAKACADEACEGFAVDDVPEHSPAEPDFALRHAIGARYFLNEGRPWDSIAEAAVSLHNKSGVTMEDAYSQLVAKLRGMIA